MPRWLKRRGGLSFSLVRLRRDASIEAVSRDYVLQPFRSEVDLQIDYAAELNPQQYAAVTAPPGPALVIAGAVTGVLAWFLFLISRS